MLDSHGRTSQLPASERLCIHANASLPASRGSSLVEFWSNSECDKPNKLSLNWSFPSRRSSHFQSGISFCFVLCVWITRYFQNILSNKKFAPKIHACNLVLVIKRPQGCRMADNADRTTRIRLVLKCPASSS